MEKIKQFFEEFASYEARMEELKFIEDIKPYNDGIHKGNTFYVEPTVVFMPLDDWDDDDIEFLGIDFSKTEKRFPRALFKISEYKHSEYGDVWLCFCSLPDHSGTKPNILSQVIAVIKQEDIFKIATTYNYSSFDSDGREYSWSKNRIGYNLALESLEGPTKIMRIQKPSDYMDGLKFYEKEW